MDSVSWFTLERISCKTLLYQGRIQRRKVGRVLRFCRLPGIFTAHRLRLVVPSLASEDEAQLTETHNVIRIHNFWLVIAGMHMGRCPPS